jgi:hypothetical protein
MAMPKVTDAAKAAFAAAFPDDDRAVNKKMFGHPAAFVNGNMFFGTFGDGLTYRLPADRLVELSEEPGVGPFEPMKGRPWKEYIFAERSVTADKLAAWAIEALEHTAKMPAKCRRS